MNTKLKAFLCVLSLAALVGSGFLVQNNKTEILLTASEEENTAPLFLAAEYPRSLDLKIAKTEEEDPHESPVQPHVNNYTAEELTAVAARYTPIPLLEREEEPIQLSAIQPGSISPSVTEPLGASKEFALNENPDGAAIITCAQHYLGVPYVYAGQSPAGFDCSGFVSYVYNSCGIPVASRSCSGIYQEAQKVLVPTMGDIVFFVDPETRSRFTHVGLYIGDNKMIHAGTSGICYTDLSISYWQPRIYGYGRIVSGSDSEE